MAIVAQSLRTTTVARLVEGPSLWGGPSTAMSSAVLVLRRRLYGADRGAFAGPLAHLLTGDASGDAHDTARTALSSSRSRAPPSSLRRSGPRSWLLWIASWP